MEERLQKILSDYGFASRRASESAIREGRVTVNGRVAELGRKADPARDTIAVDGKTLTARGPRVYIMLNKPRGYVTTVKDEKGRRSVMELVGDAGTRLYPVGRLDLNSEGLLLLTNDGEAAYRATHPSHDMPKTYLVRVAGTATGEKIRALSQRMMIDGHPVKAEKVRLVRSGEESCLLAVTIREGRNRQIRKMCEAARLRVLRLRRVSVGKLTLGDLSSGAWRYLTEDEIAYLKNG